MTIIQNTFSRGGGQSITANEETVSGITGGGMIRNRDNTANQNINTWFPTGSAAPLVGQVPAGAVLAERSPSLPADVPACLMTLNVQRPTAAPLPGTPVTIDVFWTERDRAEKHLGTARGVTGSTAQIVVEMPVGVVALPTDKIPAWMPRANGLQTHTTITDPVTGEVQGFLRVQTHVEVAGRQPQSSQLSRTVRLTGNCTPQISIAAASGQADPTTVRFLHFEITSSKPLDPATLTADDLVLDVTPTEQTIDASRINARIVSLTPVAGSEDLRFAVVVALDDSAAVTLSLPAGAVATTGGLVNLQPATGNDRTVTFANPLVASPSSGSIIMGEATGLTYHLALRPGAPPPIADVQFATTVTQGVGPAVVVSTLAPTIQAYAHTSEGVKVTAPDGDVPAGTPVGFAHTVTSADPNYDGLIVPEVQILLFSTDPRLTIARRAFVHETEASADLATITGGLSGWIEVPTGGTLLYRQPVCFVWTVKNISADAWESAVNQIVVTDSDDRLGGTPRVIGTLASLGVGESVQFAECTIMLPGDSRSLSMRQTG